MQLPAVVPLLQAEAAAEDGLLGPTAPGDAAEAMETDTGAQAESGEQSEKDGGSGGPGGSAALIDDVAAAFKRSYGPL